MSIIHLEKGHETYTFVYIPEKRTDLLRTFARYAANPELSFSWYDAATLSAKVRQLHYEEARIT
jgi:hypothetical protein